MKNISKTIAAFSLSLLTIGAMAQTPGNFTKARSIELGAPKVAAHAKHNASVTPPSYYLIDNLGGDAAITSGTFYNWSPFLYLNTKFNGADTLTSNCANSVTTVFENQLYDDYSASFYPFVAGSVKVDSIACSIRFHNTSTNNDTIILSVNAVSAKGFPTATAYATYTVVVQPGVTLPYNNIDSIQTLYVPAGVTIPNTARQGYNFGIQMTVQCNKALDTVALVYYSQGGSACSALGGDYTPEPSAIGAFDSAVNNVNTFLTGEWSYNSPGNHGDGTSLSWPRLVSPYMGYYMNAGGYYYAPLPLVLLFPSCTGDTAQFSVQDVAIYPYIKGISALGVNSITAAGLSVGQNYPNPFNKTTTISYSLTQSSDVTFTVYDMTGRVITTNSYGSVAPGQYSINLSANTFKPGIYFYTFNVNGSTVTKKMVITE